MASSSARPARRRTTAAVGTVLSLTAACALGQLAVQPALAAGSSASTPTVTAFTDGFEDQTGTTPSGRWNTTVRDCSGTGTATVDSSKAHSGTKSIKVDGKTGYCNHAFVGTTLSGGGALYVRFWVNHTTALPTGHVAFAAMQDSSDNNKDLRMGGQNQALQWNRESDDATLPAQSPVGVSMSKPLPTNTWSCLEFGVDSGHLTTWLNGTVVDGLVEDGVSTQDIDNQWIQSRPGWNPTLQNLRLGWESYSDGSDTLWFDDIAVSSSKIGC
ncbi:hydrolase [Streptomyces odontomachi]|uniref:hydrolase n=1 Tax=Streptomyces odontomachi TaxID=2944940 RepID=UPI00210D1B09|nr:hydrolase [Streptomyces sp. ODS25]